MPVNTPNKDNRSVMPVNTPNKDNRSVMPVNTPNKDNRSVMPVNTPNKFHADNAELWQMCRDFVAGAYAVRDAGSDYVPRPEGLKESEFRDYVNRGALFNATQRTVDSLVGLVMQKPPQVEIDDSLQAYLDYFDGAGSRAEDFARDAVYDVLCVGGGVAVVDTPVRPEGIVTRQQEAQSGIRPYVSWYPVESILDWRYGWINGRRELVFLRLAETWNEIVGEFDEKLHEQVRVMDIVEGSARTRIFRKGDNGQWYPHSEIPLVKDSGQPWQYIPAVMFGPVRNEPEKPPILDLVEVNRSHWQNSVDLEHALHFTGQPMLIVRAHLDEGQTVRVGSKSALVVGSDEGAEYISLKSDGLTGLENALTRKEAQMASLGARMLMSEGGQVESGEALAIRRGGENSALAKVADSVSRSMALVIETMAEWQGLGVSVSYSLNTEYLPSKMTAQELTAWVSGLNSGAVSQQEMFDAMKAGGIIRDDKTFEDHLEEIQGMADPAGLNGESE